LSNVVYGHLVAIRFSMVINERFWLFLINYVILYYSGRILSDVVLKIPSICFETIV